MRRIIGGGSYRLVGFLSGLALLSSLLFTFQNCSAVKFGSVASSSVSSGDFGHCPLQNLTTPIKVLFVVDTSGSNAQYTTHQGTSACDPKAGSCSPPTDPQKVFRGGSISAFFNAYQAKTNFSWGFEVFSGTSASSYVSPGSFGNSQAMQSALSQFYAENDSNGTPYIAALDSAQSALGSDPDINSQAVHAPLYYIIFMSDGYPTDALTNMGAVDFKKIDTAIAKIIALAPSRVVLSTVYYGTINDPVAASTLQNMASAGNGQFVNVDTSATNSIVIDDLITIPAGQCQ